MEDKAMSKKMKVVRTKREKEIVEVDEVRLDSIKIEDLEKAGRINIHGEEYVDGKCAYNWQFARCKIEDMPEDLRERLLEWAKSQLQATVQDEVDKLEAVA